MTYLELARQLAEIHKKMVKISEYIRLTDSIRGEGVVLSCLAAAGGQATPAQLSQALNVSTARIAALLNKMERKRLVKRERHPDNHRNTVVKLLPEGKKLHEEQQWEFDRRVVSFFETLGEEKAALYVELQGRMVDFMLNHQEGEGRNG